LARGNEYKLLAWLALRSGDARSWKRWAMKTNRSVTARLLAGSTHPDLLTAANTGPRQNSRLKGDQLMQAVGHPSWDVSVKGLAQFPDVINQLATNPSWTSELRDAYYNIPQDVMNAVPLMRQCAPRAGILKSNTRQNVAVENQAPASAPAATP
jgi:hypothetical protein